MNILGMGILSTRGLGVAAWENALNEGWRAPSAIGIPGEPGGQRSAYLVDLDTVADRTLLKKLRRADKLSKISVLAAADALADSGIPEIGRKKIGIILATAFGAHVTTFGFLDDILDYGDEQVSPTTFSNSVHNAAVSYVTSTLNLQGPTLTVTRFSFPFHCALQLAQAWLDQGRCDHVLVGGADLYGDVLGYVCDLKLTPARDGRIQPFSFQPTCQVPGEGAVFFLLGRGEGAAPYCRLTAVRFGEDADRDAPADLNLIDADGISPDESAYRAWLSQGTPTAAYAPLVGSMMIGGAFNLAAGALMLRRQTLFATPVQDNPHGVKLQTETRQVSIASIRSIGCNCLGEQVVTYLGRI